MKVKVPSFESAHVLVVGDLMLDRYWHGTASHISAEAPVPIIQVDQTEERPGGAGNVALNIAALGAKVTLLGVTGQDEAAQTLSDQLSGAGVRCHFERVAGVTTVTKLRILSHNQQLIRVDFEDSLSGFDPELLLARLRQALAGTDVVVLSEYGKGTLRVIRDIIGTALDAGKPVLVDPKGPDFSCYRGASVVTPNVAELEAVVGVCRGEEELLSKATALLDRHDLGALLVTRGEQGMSLLQRDHAPLHLSTQAEEVYDVTGAGDTVISVLAAALAADQMLADATTLANFAAGIVVGKLGTASVSVPEIRRALHGDHAIWRGVVDEEQLLLAIQDARTHGETIVMTNGCFDILHAGHVAYLEKARRQGERLIVAVNDDASVARIKGKDRPINALDHRMTVLAALKCVDWVVPFSEDTPERLICRVQPDLLVKGGDYTPQQVAGYECVTANGGKVVIMDFLEGFSTKGIVERCRV